MGCCDCLSKALLMSLNGFFMVQGLVLTVGMTVALVVMNTLSISDGEELGFITLVKNIAIIGLCFGATILFVSFLGCCGACCKNQCMLMTYALILVVLIVGQIVLLVMSATSKKSIQDDIEEDWRNELKNYTSSDYPRIAIDEIQENLECCGVTNFEDWRDNPYLHQSYSVPDSCCKNDTGYAHEGCGHGYFHDQRYPINKQGCYIIARDDVMFYFKIVWIFIIVVIGVQALLVLSACCLSWKKKKQSKPKIAVIY